MEMVRDIEQDTVDFQPNYDGRLSGADGPARALPQPAGQRLAPASRSAWPPTSRRTTCARSPTAPQWALRAPRRHPRGAPGRADRADQGPGLPHRRAHRGPPGHRAGLPHRPRLGHHARGRRDRRGRQGRTCLVDHRAAVPGQPGQPRAEDRRARQRRQARRHRRHPRRDLGPHRPAPRHRAQARRRREGRAQQPATSTPSCRPTSAPTCWRSSTGCRARCRSTRSSALGRPTRSRSSSGAPRYRLRKAEERGPHPARPSSRRSTLLDEVIALIRRSPDRRGGPRRA